MSYFQGKKVVVTGAGGSIGSQICKQIVEQDAESLTLVSLTESGLYEINRKLAALKKPTKVFPVLGSVTDGDLMYETLHKKDIVIHAAAHKHVPLCQQNPLEAIRNNVIGTKTLLDAAIISELDRFILVSTDKAVKPASVMGMTKRAAELIVHQATKRQEKTSCLVTRFGNVLDSAGSILPLWREQINAGGPLTITDMRCERYFMTIPQAAGLVLSVASMEEYKSGTFVFDMGKPVNIHKLALQLMTEMDKQVPIDFIGLREGDKLTEELHHGGPLTPTLNAKIFRVDDQYDLRKYILIFDLISAIRCRDEELALKLIKEMTV
jgi:FlaA1/EpsC-like NDP-sugar epimerase